MNRKRLLPFLILLILVVFLIPGTPVAAQTPVPTPALSCNPTSGFLNSAITLTGSGFPSGFGNEALINIMWDNANISTSPSPLFINNSGGFTSTIWVPQNTAFGSHTIQARGEFSNSGNLTATASFNVLPPSLELSPTSGFSTVTITGRGFLAQNESLPPIIISWDNQVIPTVPSPIIDYWTGEFTAIISVPTQTVTGNHSVKALQQISTGNITGEASFTVIDMRGAQGFSGGGGGGIGPPGPAGPQGLPGAQGPSGAQGPAGPAGASGGGGGIGPEGPRGLQGMVGLPGPAGAQGPAGPAGAIGPAGAAGPEGPSGASGTITSISIIALVVSLGTLALLILGKMKKWIFS
jgi:hypothetical protein